MKAGCDDAEVMCRAFCFELGCGICDDEGQCNQWSEWLEPMIVALAARAASRPSTKEDLSGLSTDELLDMIG